MLDLKKIVNDPVKFSTLVCYSFLGVFSFFLLVKHDLGNFQKLNQTIRDTADNIAALNDVSNSRAYIDDFNRQFAQYRQPNWLMETVTEVAGHEEIKFNSVRPLETSIEGGYRFTRIESSGFASYSGLFGLIKRIEDLNQYVFVEQFHVQPVEKGRDDYGVTGTGLPSAEQGKEEQYADVVRFTLIVASIGTQR